jgi:hypothetical protein
MEVSGQLHASAELLPGKEPPVGGTHVVVVGTRASLDAVLKREMYLRQNRTSVSLVSNP